MKSYVCILTSGFLLFAVKFVSAQDFYNDFQSGEKQLIFYDDFINNENNWEIGKNGPITASIQDGFLEVKSTRKHDTKPLLLNSKLDFQKNFEIEANISLSENDKYVSSLRFGCDQQTEYGYRFSFNNKFFIISKDSSRVDVLTKQNYNLISRGNNKLTVRKYNHTYYFYINEDRVYTTQKLYIKGSSVGFSPCVMCEMKVANLSIYYLNELSWITLWKKAEIIDKRPYYQEFFDKCPDDSLKKLAKSAIEGFSFKCMLDSLLTGSITFDQDYLDITHQSGTEQIKFKDIKNIIIEWSFTLTYEYDNPIWITRNGETSFSYDDMTENIIGEPKSITIVGFDNISEKYTEIRSVSPDPLLFKTSDGVATITFSLQKTIRLKK